MKIVNVLICYMVHGLDGDSNDYVVINKTIEEKFSTIFNNNQDGGDVKNLLYCYSSNSNAHKKTYKKTEILFEVSFNEYSNHVNNTIVPDLKKVIDNLNSDVECNLYLTVVGHSLGGIISRGVIEKIFSKYQVNTNNTNESADMITYENYLEYLKKEYPFITNVYPCSFVTLSSPHLGSAVSPISSGKTLYQKSEKLVTKVFCSYLVSDIGHELAYLDGKNDNQTALVRLCQPKAIDALGQFPNRTLLAYVRHDLFVKYCTSMGTLVNPIKQFEKSGDLYENNEIGAKILGYSGFDEEEDKKFQFYQNCLLNEKSTNGLFTPKSKAMPSPDILAQIKDWETKVNAENNRYSKDKRYYNKAKATTNENENTSPDYEKMDNEFIVDNIEECEFPVSALKLFNRISYRRVTFDYQLYKRDRLTSHMACIERKIPFKKYEKYEELTNNYVNFISTLLLTDFMWTSNQTTAIPLSETELNEKLIN